MSMPTPSLKEFMEPVPVCQQTAGMEAVREIFSDRACDRLVVVDEQQLPLGVVQLSCIVPHLRGEINENPIDASSFFLNPYIEPLATLPAHFTPSQFWPYLQDMHADSAMVRNWGLVDASGKFLGLLDSWLLLKYLALSREKTTPVSTPNNRLPASPTKATEKAASDENLFITALKPLIQLLEQIPLPLRLQTAAGKVISQNVTWRQQIGEELPEQKMLAGSWQEQLGQQTTSPYPTIGQPLQGTRYKAAARGAPIAVQAGEPRSRGSGGVPAPGMHNSPLPLFTPASQHDCPPSLYTATSLHDSSLSPGTRASSPSLKPLADDAAACASPEALTHVALTLKNSQGRVFSLVKIPLGNVVGDTGAIESGEASVQLNNPKSNPPAYSTPPYQGGDKGGSKNQKLILVMAQDVTEQQLLAKELAAKNADLIQVNRFKDEFLACISHELKTPLTAVLGLSGLLKDQLVGQLNERQAHYAQLIHQSGRTLMTVVNDILDLTRMETGCMELTPEPVNIKSVCDRAYLQARQQLSTKKEPAGTEKPEISFTLDIEAGLESIVADELRLRQMLVHLLSNALKFTDAGGEVGLKVSRWDGWIAFTVWDTGIGIPDNQQHLIFQKFQQLENPLTRQYEGTGLGLVFTQRLARLHGGDVSFISKAGKGCEFTLLLPPSPPQAAAKSVELGVMSNEFKKIPNSSSSSTQNSVRAGLMEEATNITVRQDPSRPYKTLPLREAKGQNSPSRLVLIVEAVPQYIQDLTQHLNSLGYRVVIARSGTEALEKARRLQPQAVFLNPLLPQLSGWDVLTLLKSDVQTRHISVVVTTTQVERELALANGADGFLSLPVQEHALRQSLIYLTKYVPNTDINLTILFLNPGQSIDKGLEVMGQGTDSPLSPPPGLNCRVLEAEDLDQAELLARVWHPDVVLLDGASIDEPLAYLEQFSSQTSLASLPLVTLDHNTTEAANQVTRLSVFPCLAPAGKDKTAALWQVIQVATGTICNPTILVVNLATVPDLLPPFVDFGPQPLDFGGVNSRKPEAVDADTDWELENSQSSIPKYRKGSTSQTPKTRELASVGALVQYLQTAGFRSLLSRSWAEVCRQLQLQSVDLLLIHLSDPLLNKALSCAITSVANMPVLPPIMVLDHRLDGETAHDLTPDEASSADVESILRTVATPTQILRGSSQSMAELLDKINQMLGPSY